MKKIYAINIILCMMLLCGASAKAQVSTLFGEYKFTSEMKVTEAGKALGDKFSNEGTVYSEESSVSGFVAQVRGLAGASGSEKQLVRSFESNVLNVNNPSGANWSVWKNYICMANENADYPFNEDGFELNMTYNPATKEITLPNFTLVKCDFVNSSTTILASFTNAKLTLVKAAQVDIADLTGNWHYVAGTGEWDTNGSSTYPKEFDMTIEKGESGYSVKFAIGDLPTFTLNGSFDGETLTLAVNETVIDEANGIRVKDTNGSATGNIIFTYDASAETLSGNGPTISKDGETMPLQWYSGGVATKSGSAVDKIDWTGTFTLTADVMDASYESSQKSINIVIGNDKWERLALLKFNGVDVSSLNSGATTIQEEDENTISIPAGIFVEMVTPGELYRQLVDMNGQTTSRIKITAASDGTITMDDFGIYEINYTTGASSFYQFYQNVKLTKLTSGMESLNVNERLSETRFFDISGRPVKSAAKGRMVIVKTANGVKKMIAE